MLREEGYRGEHHGHEQTTLPSQVLHRYVHSDAFGLLPAGPGNYAEKDNARDIATFLASDYTRARPMSCFEICIGQIHFSDALLSKSATNWRLLPGSASAAKLHPTNFFQRAILPSGAAIV